MDQLRIRLGALATSARRFLISRELSDLSGLWHGLTRLTTHHSLIASTRPVKVHRRCGRSH
ncbi:MAG: hypothetical protein ACREIT_08200, partial [Tepidisphaeraceae bacterium]